MPQLSSCSEYFADMLNLLRENQAEKLGQTPLLLHSCKYPTIFCWEVCEVLVWGFKIFPSRLVCRLEQHVLEENPAPSLWDTRTCWSHSAWLWSRMSPFCGLWGRSAGCPTPLAGTCWCGRRRPDRREDCWCSRPPSRGWTLASICWRSRRWLLRSSRQHSTSSEPSRSSDRAPCSSCCRRCPKVVSTPVWCICL